MKTLIARLLRSLRRVLRRTVRIVAAAAMAPFALAGDACRWLFGGGSAQVVEEEVVEESVPGADAAADAADAPSPAEIAVAERVRDAAIRTLQGLPIGMALAAAPFEGRWLRSLPTADVERVAGTEVRRLAGHLSGKRPIPGLRPVLRVASPCPPPLLPAADPDLGQSATPAAQAMPAPGEGYSDDEFRREFLLVASERQGRSIRIDELSRLTDQRLRARARSA